MEESSDNTQLYYRHNGPKKLKYKWIRKFMEESCTNNHDHDHEKGFKKSKSELEEAELEGEKSRKPVLDWKNFIPIGYKFVPSDQELLKYYLLPKVHGGLNVFPAGRTADLGIIREVDVYKSHPANLPGLDKGEESSYFFTTRDSRYEKGKRPARTTKDGNGYWRMTSKINEKWEEDGSGLGRKNTLVYHLTKPINHDEFFPTKTNQDLKTNWIMHEYVLDKRLYEDLTPQVSSPSIHKPKQVVLCRIYERKKEAAAEKENRQRYTDQDSITRRIPRTTRGSIDHHPAAGLKKRKAGTHDEIIPTKRKQQPFCPSTPSPCSLQKHTSINSSCGNLQHNINAAHFDDQEEEGELPSSQPIKRSTLDEMNRNGLQMASINQEVMPAAGIGRMDQPAAAIRLFGYSFNIHNSS